MSQLDLFGSNPAPASYTPRSLDLVLDPVYAGPGASCDVIGCRRKAVAKVGRKKIRVCERCNTDGVRAIIKDGRYPGMYYYDGRTVVIRTARPL